MVKIIDNEIDVIIGKKCILCTINTNFISKYLAQILNY